MRNYILLGMGGVFGIVANGYIDYLQAQPSQTTVPSLTEITLKVTPAELDIISEGLQTQPFGKVVPLINKLRSQVMDQQPKPQMPVAPMSSPAIPAPEAK